MIAASTSNGSLSPLELFTPAQPRLGRRPTTATPTPYLELWSTRDPVSLFGAVASSGHGGWEQVTRTIHMAVSRFSYGTLLNFELVAAEVSGELAYTVGDERSAVSFNGGPLQLTTLRVTHIYRRENGDWNSFTGTATPRSITALPPRRRPSRRHGQPDQLMSTLTI